MATEFEGMDFGAAWEEEDWERFFLAQDRLSARRRLAPPPERCGSDPSLSFRRVMGSFGMDPDNPESPPRPFALSRTLTPDGAPGLPFWHPHTDPERLPLFLQAGEFARRLQELVELRFAAKMAAVYRSAAHRHFQRGLAQMHELSRTIPRLVSQGHRTGYDPAGAKGNVVRCRQALERADACVRLFPIISPRLMGPELHKSLLSDCLKLRNALWDWILLLRTRFASPRPERGSWS